MIELKDFYSFLGWADIGYNFLVGEDGNVYEGRGWSLVGAHCVGYNSKSIGISVIGDYTSRKPTAAALNTVKALIQCGISKGLIRSNYVLRGHRFVLICLNKFISINLNF